MTAPPRPALPAADRPVHASSRSGRAVVAAVMVAVGSVAAAACASSTGTATGTSTAAGPSSTPTTAAAASSYASIADLQKALESKSITCKLEYPGLKDDTAQTELSICVIDGEQAFLKIWLEPTQIKEFLASPDGQTGTVAVGENWTITLTTNAAADKVAKAIGGTAPSGSASGTGASR